MTRYVVKRLALMLPVLWGAGTFTFFLLRVLPGDALSSLLAESAPGVDVHQLRAKLGLDDSLLQQYLDWIRGTVTLDFGSSLLSDTPVRSQLLDAIPISAEIALLAILSTVLIGIPLGMLAAAKQDSLWDHGARGFAILFMSVPNFWLATLVLVLPAIWFGWIPPLRYVPIYKDPWTNLQQFIFPSAILGLGSSAVILRMVRSQMLEVLRQDYIRSGRAKGLTSTVVLLRHAAPNALMPVLALLGNEFARILGGTVILEEIFGLPGIGRLTIEAISKRDYPQVELNVLFFALVFVIANLMVDLSYGALDPRVRHVS